MATRKNERSQGQSAESDKPGIGDSSDDPDVVHEDTSESLERMSNPSLEEMMRTILQRMDGIEKQIKEIKKEEEEPESKGMLFKNEQENESKKEEEKPESRGMLLNILDRLVKAEEEKKCKMDHRLSPISN